MYQVKLGDVDFSAEVYSYQIDWQNQFVYSSVKTVQDYGWDGDHVVWQNQTHGGRPIQLIAKNDEGSVLNEEQVKKIHAMFNTPGAQTFEYNDTKYQVIITAFNPTCAKGYSDEDDRRIYTATIDLIEVI